MKHLPTLKQLQYLVALDEEGSFSAAANICNVTQSTLSAGIASLEQVLRQEIVDRSHHRKVVFTPLGQEILGDARELIGKADAMVSRALHVGKPMSGPLRLGVIPTIAPYLLPEVLPRLQKQYPDAEVQLHEDLTERLVEALHAGRIDVAILAFPYETPGLTQRILFEEPFVLACPKGKSPDKENLVVSDIQNMNILLLEDGHCLRDHAMDSCKIQLPPGKKTFSATSLPTLIQMVRAGYGYTLLPQMAVETMSLSNDIDVVKFKNAGRQIGLAWRNKHPRESDFQLLGDVLSGFR